MGKVLGGRWLNFLVTIQYNFAVIKYNSLYLIDEAELEGFNCKDENIQELSNFNVYADDEGSNNLLSDKTGCLISSGPRVQL